MNEDGSNREEPELPAVTLKQFRLYRTGKTPWAYASWALLTEEAERRLANGQRRLQSAEWRAGDRPWLIDVICPFGGPEAVLKDIRDNVFPDKSVKALVPAPDGKGIRVMVLRGKNVEDGGRDERMDEAKGRTG